VKYKWGSMRVNDMGGFFSKPIETTNSKAKNTFSF